MLAIALPESAASPVEMITVVRLFTRQLSGAVEAVTNASAAGSSKQRKKLLHALAGWLKGADQTIRKAQHAKGDRMVSAVCAGAVYRVVGQARGLLSGVQL